MQFVYQTLMHAIFVMSKKILTDIFYINKKKIHVSPQYRSSISDIITLFSQVTDIFSSGFSKSTRKYVCACAMANRSEQSPQTYKGGGRSPHCMEMVASKHI